MDLALRGPCADRAPGHRVRDVLRRDRVEPFAAHRQAVRDDVAEQLAGGAQAAVHVVAAVHARVVDQALPAGYRARLLEVHPHHDQQIGPVELTGGPQPAGVVERGRRVVHRAGPGDDQQAVVVAVEDGADLAAALLHRRRGRLAQRQLVEQGRGGQQRFIPGDPGIAGPRRKALVRYGPAGNVGYHLVLVERGVIQFLAVCGQTGMRRLKGVVLGTILSGAMPPSDRFTSVR